MKNFLDKYKNVLGLIIIPLITILIPPTISKLLEPKMELSATLESINRPIPSKLTDDSSYYMFCSRLDSLLSSQQKQSEQKMPFNLGSSIEKLVRKSFILDELHHSSIGYGSYARLIISNIGDKEIKDIEVSAPYRTYYEFVKNDESIATGLFKEKIGVGYLRSSENVLVRLWGSKLDDSNIIVTFPDGKFKPKELAKISGFYAFLAKYFSGLPSILYLIFLIAYFIIIGYSILYTNGYRITKLTHGES
ncbi:MAG: hypothetical protein M0Q53_20135 [Prolixibacteraceae bacterium]|nr:hypothetical protein [Prolixibacteraceae bacterium]